MFQFRQFSEDQVNLQLTQARNLDLSYAAPLYTEQGSKHVQVPNGYKLDRTRSKIGHGVECFELAKRLLREWQHFQLDWVRVANPAARIALGEVVAVEAHALGLWSLNFSRILYVIDEPNRFGYGYGTTKLHVERGEERFLIQFDSASNSVHYDLLAISQPSNWLAVLGYPYTRRCQKRFARESHLQLRHLVHRLQT